MLKKLREYERHESSVKEFFDGTMTPFMSTLSSTINSLTQELKDMADYRAKRNDLESYLRGLREELEYLPEGLSSVQVASQRLDRCREIKTSMGNIEERFAALRVMKGCHESDTELEPLKYEIEQIKELLPKVDSILIKSINTWNEYEILLDKLNEWLLSFDGRLQKDTRDLQAIMSDLDVTGDKLFALIDSDVLKNHVISIHTHYAGLLNQLVETKGKVDRMKGLRSAVSSSSSAPATGSSGIGTSSSGGSGKVTTPTRGQSIQKSPSSGSTSSSTTTPSTQKHISPSSSQWKS